MSGTTDKLKGLVNEAVGNVTGNDKLVAEGEAQELKGETRKTVGDAEDGAASVVDKVTDKR